LGVLTCPELCSLGLQLLLVLWAIKRVSSVALRLGLLILIYRERLSLSILLPDADR
jgi:hypothetical protein